MVGPNHCRANVSWNYLPNLRGTSSVPWGHRPYRYVYTIIALNEPPKIPLHDYAMAGKVIGRDQWVDVFGRPWPVDPTVNIEERGM